MEPSLRPKNVLDIGIRSNFILFEGARPEERKHYELPHWLFHNFWFRISFRDWNLLWDKDSRGNGLYSWDKPSLGPDTAYCGGHLLQ